VVDDRLIWKAEKNGLYSVKSAYRLCMEELVDVSHLRRPGYWSGIWRLKVPPKIKNLLWRMCRGCLPTRVRLQDKGVQCPTSCVSCDGPHEDLAHICFECPFTVQVWRTTGLWNTVHKVFLEKNSAADAIFELLHQLSQEFSQRFAAVLWSLWKHRNIKLWQDVTETCANVVDRACHIMEDWYAANATIPAASRNNTSTNSVRNDQMTTTIPVRQSGSGTTRNSSATTSDMASVRWQRPQRGRLKCNVDASFSDQLNRTGIGICVRDDEGTFVLAKTVSISPMCSVAVGEALGLFHALQWLSDMQFDNVDFVLDSKITTDAFNHRWIDVTEFGQVISACQSLFNTNFSNSKVEFNRRQANEVAHTLAGVATLSASPNIYYRVPRCINSLIINEML
jgi:ribonuclease HI